MITVFIYRRKDLSDWVSGGTVTTSFHDVRNALQTQLQQQLSFEWDEFEVLVISHLDPESVWEERFIRDGQGGIVQREDWTPSVKRRFPLP